MVFCDEGQQRHSEWTTRTPQGVKACQRRVGSSVARISSGECLKLARANERGCLGRQRGFHEGWILVSEDAAFRALSRCSPSLLPLTAEGRDRLKRVCQHYQQQYYISRYRCSLARIHGILWLRIIQYVDTAECNKSLTLTTSFRCNEGLMEIPAKKRNCQPHKALITKTIVGLFDYDVSI